MNRAIILGTLAAIFSVISSIGLVFFMGKDTYTLGLISAISVGLAVYFGTGYKKEFRFGILAVVICLISIVGGKFLVAEAIARTNADTILGIFRDDRFFIYKMTGQAITELKQNPEALKWPAGMNEQNAKRPEDFPPAVWKRATELFEALPAEEKAAKRNAQKSVNQTLGFNELIAMQRREILQESFSIRQIVLNTLILITAYGLGSGKFFE